MTHHSRPNQEKDDEQEIFYTTAIEPHVPGNVPEGQPVILQGGEYVQFNYEGPLEGLQNFILTLYGTCLPQLELTHAGKDTIERFFPQRGGRKTGLQPR